MPPKSRREAGEFKDDDDVHSQDAAVTESCRRAKFIISLCNTSDDKMATFFDIKGLMVVEKIYHSTFNWRSWRRAIIEKFCEIKFMDMLADAATYAVSGVELPEQYGQVATDILYGLICTATDCSQMACRAMLAKDMVRVMINNIASEENRENGEKSHLISLNMSSLHNIAKLAESKEKFEAVNAIEVIKPYFDIPDEKLQISALSAVACLVSDSQSSATLLDDHEIIPELVKCLGSALHDSEAADEHLYLGFSAEELVESLAFLAVNDDNKIKIAKSGAPPLLVEMLRSSDTVEQGRAIDCLWALSFNENIRKDILQLEDCSKLMEKIATSSTDAALKLKAGRALDFIKVGKAGLAAEKKVGPDSKKEKDGKTGHIFISYQHQHQETALMIRQLMLDNAYTVWMDIDNMHNNTLEAMAQGVEDAALILILYSEYYKQSNMCRTEAEYVFRLGKPFIPVNLQYRYFPTGWLGIILGTKLYVDFSLQKHPLEEVSARLLHEIEMQLKGAISTAEGEQKAKTLQVPNVHGAPSSGRPISSHAGGVCQCCKMMEKLVNELVSSGTVENYVPTPPSDIEKGLREWNTDKVRSWLCDEGLSHVSLQGFDGPALLGLHDMKRSASDIYYSSLMKLVGDSFADCIKVTSALDKLLNLPLPK